MSYIPFKGWAPDVDPTQEGVITDASNLVPTLRGFKAGEILASTGYPALPSTTLGGAIVYRLDDTNRLIVGTISKLYEGSGGVWTDQSKSGGYTGSTDNKWRFDQLGNVTLATNKSDTIQFSNNTGPFDSLPSPAPKAAIIQVVKGFVMAFNLNDITDGDIQDGWACSGLDNYPYWPSRPPTLTDAANQSAYGRLLSSPGPIKAARTLGDNVIVYKERSMYIGQYIGPPFVWSFTKLPGEVGAPCQEAVVTTGSLHFFVGPDDFYVFDGTRPQSIGNPVKNWFFKQLNQTSRYKIQAYHNRLEANIYFYFPSLTSTEGNIDKCIVYNYKADKWAPAAKSIETVLDVISGGITYDELGSLYPTWEDLPMIAYDSPFWIPNLSAQAVFDSTHTLMSVTGEASDSSVTTHEMGDDDRFSTFDRAKPRFLQYPASGNAVLMGRRTTDEEFIQANTSDMIDGKFDMMNSDRWHKVRMNFTGPMEISGVNVNVTADGTE